MCKSLCQLWLRLRGRQNTDANTGWYVRQGVPEGVGDKGSCHQDTRQGPRSHQSQQGCHWEPNGFSMFSGMSQSYRHLSSVSVCECMTVYVHRCMSGNVCVSALYVCLYASVVHIKNFSHISWPVLKLQTFELCKCVWVHECVCAQVREWKCVCESIVCVPVCLSSPHEKC